MYAIRSYYASLERVAIQADTELLNDPELFARAAAPLQAVVGDFHGLNVKEHQPIKVAAMEGIWPETEAGAPLLLFAVPDMESYNFV